MTLDQLLSLTKSASHEDVVAELLKLPVDERLLLVKQLSEHLHSLVLVAAQECIDILVEAGLDHSSKLAADELFAKLKG